jgi:hypothetical protein
MFCPFLAVGRAQSYRGPILHGTSPAVAQSLALFLRTGIFGVLCIRIGLYVLLL